MNKTTLTSYGGLKFGSSFGLTPEHINQLSMVFNAPKGRVDTVLGGRSSVSVIDLKGIGQVLVKPYSRGGLVRYIIKDTYLRIGKPRCRVEFEQMQHAGRMGISVPEPVAYAYQGRIFYRAWLITRKINAPRSLAELSCADAEQTQMVLEKVTHQISELVHHHIYHADLHPGNVLIDHDNNVYLIDFDKAHHYSGSKSRLQAAYHGRWKRAVLKYDLPKMLLSAVPNPYGSAN